MFEGVLRDAVTNDLNYMESNRMARVTSAQQLTELRDGGQRLLHDYIAQIRPSASLGSSGAPHVETTAADQPIAPPIHDMAQAAIQREVIRC